MKTFADVIELWPSLSAFAADVGAPYGAAKQWRRRNSIPAEYWARLVEMAAQRGLPVTANILAEIARTRGMTEAA